MIPSTFQVTALVAAVAFVCWGSWAAAFKLAGPKWRFEHFYFDFAFGAFAATLIAGFTLGSAGEGLTFADAFLVSGRRQWALAAVAGGVFNLGNMLVLAAVEIGGLALALPLAMSTAGTILAARILVANRGENPALLVAGIALLIASIGLLAFAAGRRNFQNDAGPEGNRKLAKKPSAAKPVALAIAGGVFVALSNWPLASARQGIGDITMGPYALAMLFCVGILLTTIVYNLYFLNLPVHGEPAGFGGYLQGGMGAHLLGLLGGILFAGGLLAAFVAAEADGAAALSAGVNAILVPASAVLAGLWGLLVWREFQGSRGGAFAFLGLLCLAAGLAAVAVRLGV
jgi:glucose uptake protein